MHLARSQGVIERRSVDGYEEFYWSHAPFPDWPTGHDYQDRLEAKGVDLQALCAPLTKACAAGVPVTLHQTTWAGERARSFIERHRDEAWFLSVNLFDPHPPFDPPAEYLLRFDPAAMPDPRFHPNDVAHQTRFLAIDQQARNAVDPWQAAADIRDGRHQEADPSSRHDTPPAKFDAWKIRAAYHAMVALIDEMIGGLLRTLDETNQREDTLVVFMSDHGEMLGDQGLLYKGCRFYEGLIHVPLVIGWPAQMQSHLRSDALVELVDVAPTLLDAGGIAPAPAMQGQSLLPLLRGKVAPRQHKSFVLSEYYDSIRHPGTVGSRGSMYFDGRYELAVYHDGEEGELYDLENDPAETHDLARSNAGFTEGNTDASPLERDDARVRRRFGTQRRLLKELLQSCR